MALTLYANPYAFDAQGFYFKDEDEFEKKAEKSGVEEFEIEFIDGTEIERLLFDALDVNQATLDDYFDKVYSLDDDDILKIAILDELGYKDAADRYEDLIIYGQFPDDATFAMEFVDDIGGLEYAINKDQLESYFDYDSFGRDLRLDGLGWDEETETDMYEDMTDQEIGEDYVDSIGGVAELGKETAEQYFDWERYARDLMMDMGKTKLGASLGEWTYFDPSSV